MPALLRLALLPALALSLSACATLVHGGSQEISFSSDPSGATVFVDGQNIGVTPMLHRLSRKSQHTVELALPGYEPQSMILQRERSGWRFGNLLFGGIVGLLIDYNTGAVYRLSTDTVSMRLREEQASRGASGGSALMVAFTLDADPSLEPIAQLRPVR